MGSSLGFTLAPGVDGYSIERHKFGVILRGTPRVDDVVQIMKGWKREGLDLIAIGLAGPLGATMVATKWEDHASWIAEVEEAARARYPDDPEGAWLFGPHTGTSSLTLFRALCSEKWRAPARARMSGEAPPQDFDDFCRCRRVVEDVRPEWRGRLVAVMCGRPAWDSVIRNWDRLSALARAAQALPRKSRKAWLDGWRELAERYKVEVARG